MRKDARFYFANLGADVARCISAAQSRDIEDYEESLERAYRTLEFMQSERPEAYEEGLLMLRALAYAYENGELSEFDDSLNRLIAEYSPLA